MPISTTIIIIDKSGTIKELNAKDLCEEDIYKKCGFKKPDAFAKQHTWSIRVEKEKYYVSAYGKEDGKANMENKYDFPPPIDNKLFFGSCAVVAQMKKTDGTFAFVDLSEELWEKMYEKLFGGFEDLVTTIKQDEMEEDELENVPKHKKTKDGYLKDGFVVDSDKEDEDSGSNSDDDSETSYVDEGEEEEDEMAELLEEDIGSELSEDSYDYSE